MRISDQTKNSLVWAGILIACGIALAIALQACTVGCTANIHTKSEVTDFAVESLAMAVGYEVAQTKQFIWDETVQAYYDAIIEGEISLNGARRAEDYLRSVTHPLIANRLIKLAGMCGFDLDDYGVIGVESVDMDLLRVAAVGFKQGLELE